MAAYLTVEEVAGVYGVKPATVRYWVRTGKCVGMYFRTPGGRALFYPDAIGAQTRDPDRVPTGCGDTIQSVLNRHYQRKKKARA